MNGIRQFALRRSELERFFESAALLRSLQSNYGSEGPSALSRNLLAFAFDQFWPKLKKHREVWAENRRRTASGFNVFDFISPSENVLSDILQFFLDPEASHGQGDIFLRLLLARARPELSAECKHATVAREALTYSIPKHRRRIDILVMIPEFVLAIETKKFTGEGNQQIHDYCQHLQNIARKDFCLVFLTRTGDEALSIAPEVASGFKKKRQLITWSWEKDIPAWLQECSANCEPKKIHHFLEDFAGYIAAYLASEEHIDENDENE
jgi:hypothetical protein